MNLCIREESVRPGRRNNISVRPALENEKPGTVAVVVVGPGNSLDQVANLAIAEARWLMNSLRRIVDRHVDPHPLRAEGE